MVENVPNVLNHIGYSSLPAFFSTTRSCHPFKHVLKCPWSLHSTNAKYLIFVTKFSAIFLVLQDALSSINLTYDWHLHGQKPLFLHRLGVLQLHIPDFHPHTPCDSWSVETNKDLSCHISISWAIRSLVALLLVHMRLQASQCHLCCTCHSSDVRSLVPVGFITLHTALQSRLLGLTQLLETNGPSQNL